MAVVELNPVTKAKLVYQSEDPDGEMKQTTKTFSNLVDSASNDAIYAGLSAVAGLLDDVAAQVIRVDETELTNE